MKDFNILHSKLIFVPVFLLSIVATVYLLQIVLTFLSQFSWLFIILIYAYIIYVFVGPLDRTLQKMKVSTNISLYLSFLIIIAVLVVIIFFLNPIIAQELTDLSKQLQKTDLNNTFGSFIDGLSRSLSIDTNQLRTTIFDNVRNFGITITNNAINIVSNALFTFLQLFLALIFGFFFIKDGKSWFKGFLKVVPENYRDEVNTILIYFNKSATSFLRVQVFMAFVYGILNYVVMSALGINFALTASIVAFLTFIIPGIGPLLSMIVPITVVLLFDPSKILLLVIILLIIQQLILNIIVPKVYGDQMGVHPLVILLSILVGYQLFGVLGAFVVIPLITVAINVASIYYTKAVKN